MTVEELVKEVITATKTQDISLEDNAILANVDSLINELRGNGITGKSFKDYSSDELSRIQGSLAILKDNLGQILAKTQSFAKYSEGQLSFRKARIRKLVIEQMLKEEEAKQEEKKPYKKMTVDDIDAELNIQTYREKQIYLARDRQASEVSNKLWAVNGILDAISQRIGVLQSNKADTKYYDNAEDTIIDTEQKLRDIK